MVMPQAQAEGNVLVTSQPGRRAPGSWLWISRVTVLLLATATIVLLIAGAPRSLATMQQACSGRLCLRGQVHISAVWQLEQLGLTVREFGGFVFGLQAVCALLHIAVASVIFRRRWSDGMALLGATTLLVSGAIASEIVLVLDEAGPVWWWAVQSVETLNTILLTCFYLFFPNGRLLPRWSWWLAPLLAGAVIALDLLPYAFGSSRSLGRFSSFVFDAWLVSLVLVQIFRYLRTATPTEQHQTRWVLGGLIVAHGGYALVDNIRLATGDGVMPPFLSWTSYYVFMSIIPLAFGMAILRGKLYDIDIIVNRSLVYGILTACVAGIYTLIVGYLGALFHANANLLISLIATGVVAVLFQPLRERLQRGVNRLMYGDRDDPYRVISRLGEHVGNALVPDTILPSIVQTIREALRVPYVAIVVSTEGNETTASSTGTPVAYSLHVPLVHQGERLGRLEVGRRGSGEPWKTADQQLLTDLARQAGAAVRAIRLTQDLQQARARLVAAREEERRRLRRDLHDGLGPVLAALAMQADTARELIYNDPDAASMLLAELTTHAQTAVVDIRRLVYDLRPPALDDLGLIAALRGYTNTLIRAGLTVQFEAPDQLPPLPAAGEVAAYRIVQEAVTNVVRHAQARRCTIRLHVDASLWLEIEDDGRGIGVDRQAGVGLASMHERAQELGGELEVVALQQGGTLVRARLPLE